MLIAILLVLELVGNNSVVVQSAKVQSSLNIQTSPNPAQYGNPIVISGILSGRDQPLPVQEVKIQYSTDAKKWKILNVLSTDSDGKFSSVMIPSLRDLGGQFYLRAIFSGSSQYLHSESNVVLQNVRSQSTTKYAGLNYLTLYHLYDTPSTILERDFARFKRDGVNAIAIVMFWYRLEPSKGIYNLEFVNNVIRVSNIANNYGIKVMLDFHTLIGEGDTWSNPEYVGVAMNLIVDREVARAYVAMVKWAVGKLKVLPNILAYSLLNEPWFWPLDELRKTNWIDLVVDLSNVTRTLDSRPVTVRFVSALFERDWNWNSRLLRALDFISFNAYVSESATDDVYWNSFDEYRNELSRIVQKATALGKGVMVTEFGSSASDDALQAEEYMKYIEILNSTTGLMGWLSWGWDSGYDPLNPSFSQIGSMSVVDRVTGTPRPAYYYL